MPYAMPNHEGLKAVLLRITPALHRKLQLLALRRSAELGGRVSMGTVIDELVTQMEQMDDPETRAPALFAARD
jgi:hypothetical protein